MSRADVSYLDWELNLKKKPKFDISPIAKVEKVNSLGIPANVYKDFLKDWKKKNLP